MSDSIFYAIIGGAMIGLAAAGMLIANGRILGVSGIISGTLRVRKNDTAWRVAFFLGIVGGSLLIEPLGFSMMTSSIDRTLPLIGLGGLFVGFGTSVGSGCTSGHGVCGISRLSKRSIIATLVFMASGIASVAILNLILGQNENT